MRESRALHKAQFVYNMSVTVAFERRRAHVHRLQVHIRRFAAFSLCGDVFATVPWIPSDLNTSDAGSRKFDPLYDVGQSLPATLEEKHTRQCKYRIFSGSSQDPFTSQSAPLRPSCRRDTDDAIVVIHDSRLNETARQLWSRHRQPRVQSRTTLKNRPSRTQQRHLEYLGTSLQTLANNDCGSLTAVQATATTRKSQAAIWSRADTESCKRGARGASVRSCRQPRRRSPDTRGIWSDSYDGPTTRDANSERTTLWTSHWWNS